MLGLIPFLPGEIELRPGDCTGLESGCWAGLAGVDSREPDLDGLGSGCCGGLAGAGSLDPDLDGTVFGPPVCAAGLETGLDSDFPGGLDPLGEVATV